MLMMSRRQGEAVLIGDDIEIQVVQISRTRIKLGIRAPRELTILAREIKLVREENVKAAAAEKPAFENLLSHLKISSHSSEPLR
jgi:carbon storage regulator